MSFNPKTFIECCKRLGLSDIYFNDVLALDNIRRSPREAEILAGRALRDLLIQFNNKLGSGHRKDDIILDTLDAGNFLEELSKYKIPTRYEVIPPEYKHIPDYFANASEIFEDARTRCGDSWKLSRVSLPKIHQQVHRHR